PTAVAVARSCRTREGRGASGCRTRRDQMKYIFSLALLLSAAAQSAPVANLALSCPSESAIGQAGLDSCRGYVYQLPTSDRIVASGSNQTHFWRRAGDLIGADTVLVCTIPVEPGKYS